VLRLAPSFQSGNPKEEAMPAVADPDSIELDEKIAAIDLSTASAVAEWFRALRAGGINFYRRRARRAGQRRDRATAVQR